MKTHALSLALVLSVVLIACAPGSTSATYGADVSQATDAASWTCLRQNGYHFGVVRAYQSFGAVDPNAANTVHNAWAGGMSHVDVYMFPCPHCGKSAATQVDELISHLRSHNVKFGMLWFDIEGSSYWRDQSFNRRFLAEAMSKALAYGERIGIYTSASQWEPIMGNWDGGRQHPLWYAHYDDNPSFSDFRPFGGWTRPSIKQFAGTTSLCRAGIDKNWYP